MNRLRLGIALLVLDLAWVLPFMWGAGLFTPAGIHLESRGAGVNFLAFGLVAPMLVSWAAFALVALGWASRKARAVATYEAPAAADATMGRRQSGWVAPLLLLAGLAVASTFIGAFSYGAGESFALSEEAQIAVRITQHWERCGVDGPTQEDVQVLMMRGTWPSAAQCADCFDAHEACAGDDTCDEVCSLSPPVPVVPTLEEFGGSQPTELLGMWNLSASGASGGSFTYTSDSYEQTALLKGALRVVRGRWAARESNVAHTWEVLHVPAARHDVDPWTVVLQKSGSEEFRWVSEGLVFRRGEGYGRLASGSSGRSARVPRVRTGDADVRGSLSKEVIRRVVQRHINEVRFCYEQQLNQRPDLEGRISVQFVISPTGAVQMAAVSASNMGSPPVETCIAGAVHRWSFPAPEGGGIVVVNYPFVLQATDDERE